MAVYCLAVSAMAAKLPESSAAFEINSPPMPRAEAPARRKAAAVSRLTPPVGIMGIRSAERSKRSKIAGIERGLRDQFAADAEGGSAGAQKGRGGFQVDAAGRDHGDLGQRGLERFDIGDRKSRRVGKECRS